MTYMLLALLLMLLGGLLIGFAVGYAARAYAHDAAKIDRLVQRRLDTLDP